MNFALEISGLVKYYHSGIRGVLVEALSGVDMSVKQGEVFGLLGPNGAGKSTTIKIILGLLKPNAGSCKIFGSTLSTAVKRRIGYWPESPNFYKFLSARELVVFYARVCGLGKKEASERAEEALEMVGLKDAMDRRLGEYSKGMLQRAGLAGAIVHNPDFVILDEPSSGLDPVGMSDMCDMILELKRRGKTVLLSSHLLSEVESVCDSVAILNRGRVAACGALSELLNAPDTSELEFKNLSAEATEKISELAASEGAKLVGVRPAKIPLKKYFESVVSRGGEKDE